jgi:beta-glucosidase
MYKDANAPIDARAADLLSRMTLDEKIAQVECIWGEKSLILNDTLAFDPEKAARYFPHGLGQIGRPGEGAHPGVKPNRGPREEAILTNSIQRYFVENTRLGIPVVFHEECLHGHMARGGTNFPAPIAMACSWDEPLIEKLFSAAAVEMRSRGAHQALAPVIDVARDARWGRFEETFGEDPYLVGRMGVAAVKGLQGSAPLIDGNHVAATLKHMAGHGQPESGMNGGPGNYSERIIREVFLSPFKTCILEANAKNVMASYNEIDGVPSHANRWMLTDILRKEWGFKGCVVADYYGIQQLYERHHVVSDDAEAAKTAITAGVDIELPDRKCYPALKALIEQNKAPVAALDSAVTRLLKVKFLLGLFEKPYVDPSKAELTAGNEQNRLLAREVADKTMILLKNEKRLLPISVDRYKTIGVIGPNADKVLLGGYSDAPNGPVTLLEGIKKRVNGASKILYAEGCRITEPGGSWFTDEVKPPDPAEEEKRMFQAIEAARKCDVVILALGGNEETSREAYYEKHLGDSPTLDLLGNQVELTRRILALGKPVVVALFHGRPHSIGFLKDNVPAILDCWYGGQEAGTAAAAAIFGDVNPGGKLAASIPRSAGHIPAFYNYKPTARRGFLFDSTAPLFAFGYGLSYTTFMMGEPKLAKQRIGKNEATSVSVEVKNTGEVSGDEVVQLYIRDCVSSVTRPVKELKGFKRVTLKPGESRTVNIDITPEKLSFYDASIKFIVEPGEFEIMVGSSSRNEDLKKIVLTVEK